jgi:hypothetical protein
MDDIPDLDAAVALAPSGPAPTGVVFYRKKKIQQKPQSLPMLMIPAGRVYS